MWRPSVSSGVTGTDDDDDGDDDHDIEIICSDCSSNVKMQYTHAIQFYLY